MTLPGNDQFVDRLTLNRIDRDIFTGLCHSGAPMRAFGGQIAGQALLAAGETVADPERRVHSLHGYFLRPGKTMEPITYLVDRPRDGGSFSTRIVRAVQDGETIFFMTASFANTSDGPEHQFLMKEVRPPEELDDIDALGRLSGNSPDPTKLDFPADLHIAMRLADDGETGMHLVDERRYERGVWVKVLQDLPDSPLVHASALTYISDLMMVSAMLAPHTSFLRNRLDNAILTASIDHAMWFHDPVRVTDWLFFDQDTPVDRHGHGLARGLFYNREGRLVASVVQEGLIRSMRPQ